MNDAKRQVPERIRQFQETKKLDPLRQAADLLDGIDVHNLTKFEERQSGRKTKLALWLAVLDSIDSATDGKWDAADVPAMRIVPPPGAADPGALVASADTITDPVQKRKYEDAVARNAEKTQRYVFQKELRQLNNMLTQRAETYIRSAFLKSPESAKMVDEAVRKQVHNSQRAKEIRALVAR